MAIGTILTGAATAASVYSSLKSGSAASKAAAQNAKLTDAQIANLERAQGIYTQGGQDLRSALGGFIDTYGDAGFFNPQQIDDMAALLSNEKDLERWDVQQKMGDILSQSSGAINKDLMKTAHMAGLIAPSTMRGIRNVDMNVGANMAGSDRDISSLAGDYLANFDRETDDAANQMLADLEADGIRNGTELSTSQIEARKAAGDMIADRRSSDVTRALEAAIGTLGGRQGLAAGEQGMRLSEMGGNLNMAEFERAIADMGFNQNLASLQATQGLESNAANKYWANRQNAMGEIAGIESLLPSDLMNSYTGAMGLQGTLGGLRGQGISELTNMTLAPYQFEASGANDIGKLAAYGAAGAGDMFKNTASIAKSSWNSVGQGLDKMFKNVSWDDFNFGSSSNSTPSLQVVPSGQPSGFQSPY